MRSAGLAVLSGVLRDPRFWTVSCVPAGRSVTSGPTAKGTRKHSGGVKRAADRPLSKFSDRLFSTGQGHGSPT